MFLEIENQIINLNTVTVIRVTQTAQGIWSVQIEAEKGNIIFNKDFNNAKDAEDYGNKFSTLLKPSQLS
jgi:hypothetical protein